MEKRDIAKALLEINAQCVKSNYKCNNCAFRDLCVAAVLHLCEPKRWNFKELLNIAYGRKEE